MGILWSTIAKFVSEEIVFIEDNADQSIWSVINNFIRHKDDKDLDAN